jgi:ribosomal protein L7/L12
MNSEVVITEQELPKEVIRAIEGGRKIEAIKILRETKGLGLANAKVLVDRAASRLAPKQSISAMVEQDNNSGNLLKSLLLVTLLVALYGIVGGF